MQPTAPQALNSPEFLRRVNVLRHLDNVTNGFYLAREYLYLALVAGFTIVFYQHHAEWGFSWAWNVPVTFLAVVLMGVGQHRVVMLGHEASHYVLFRNRLLNELASDFCCFFPIFSSTHNYRLQHLAHHQFVNDPERDPDLVFMHASGHEFHYPLSRGRFLWECVVKQFCWVPGLIRYMRIRARYAGLGEGTGVYRAKANRSRLLVRVGVVYLLAQVGSVTALVWRGQAWALAVVPAALWVAVMAFYMLVPATFYRETMLKSDVAPRWATVLRLSYLTLVFNALAWATFRTGAPWWLFYLLLWVVPLLTTFPYLMILREEVQHGEAGRERFTHTRLFRGNPLCRWAVFPLGMDYHLPHHLFPMVPHFRLRELHDLLMATVPYGQLVTFAEGYLLPDWLRDLSLRTPGAAGAG